MKIAVVGCSHGEMDNIYRRTQQMEYEQRIKIDLLICCGDFQATRNESDLRCMAVPPKFYNMGTFYKYYSGEVTAPYLTIFIGGNHEASNYMQELPYGGWVAPNIYYLGYAGVVNYRGLRIGGLSGISKPKDYMLGHFEIAPFSEDTKRSVYHVRNLEVFRLKQLSNTLDIMLSHDWPRKVYTFGDCDELIRNKPFFEREVNENRLGSQPCEELLSCLKPKNWFAAHLHTKFCANVPHFDEDGSRTAETKFMALDKCLPRRRWIEIVDIPATNDSQELTYDLEWLTVLYLTDHLMSSKRMTQYMPGSSSDERWNFTPTDDEKAFVMQKMNDNLQIPHNFVRTAPFPSRNYKNYRNSILPPHAVINPQTVAFCERLSVRDPITELIQDRKRMSCGLSSPIGFSTPERSHHSIDSTYMSFDSSFVSDSESYNSQRSSMCDSSVPESCTPDRSLKKCKLSLPPIERSSTNVTNVETSPERETESGDIDTSLFTIDRNGSVPNTSRSGDVESFYVDRNGQVPDQSKSDFTSDSSFLSFSIDRKGSLPETPASHPKKQFKRRNIEMYRE